MNIRIRRLFAAILAAAMLLAFAACKKSGPEGATAAPEKTAPPQPDTYTLSVDARNAYVHPDLPEEVRSALTGEGLLLKAASVNLQQNSSVLNAFDLLGKMYGINAETDPETGAVVSINGVANGSCGEQSYWVILVNGEPVDTTLAELTAKNGDAISLIFTCNGGEDLSDPGSTVYPASTPDPNVTREPEVTATPEITADPNATPDPGSKTSGRH